MNFPGFFDAVKNPITHSLMVEDLYYLAAPTPPGSEERITSSGDIRITDDGDIRITD